MGRGGLATRGLVHDRTRRALVVIAGLFMLMAQAAAHPILAASPSPSPAGGDPRSSGQGPGLVGEPFLALAIVGFIAIVAIALSLAYVRLTPPPDRSGRPPA